MRNYFASISAARATGDPSEFIAASAQDCANCLVLANNIKAAYAKEGRIESDEWRIESARFQRKAPLGMIWNVEIYSPRERWYDADDNLVKIVRADSLAIALALVLDGDSWVVRELRINA